MSKYTEEDLADLTDAERTALLEEDNQETTASAATDDDKADDAKADPDPQAQAAPDDGAGADAAVDAGADAGQPGADAGAKADAAADEPGAKAQPVEKVTVAPVLVAEAPENVEAQLAEIGTKKDALEAKFDEGDLTRAEYRKEMDALNKSEREIEQAQLKAQLANEMNEQAMQTAWRTTAQSFAKLHKYSDNPRLFRLFDLEVQDVATSGKHTTWDDILETAHANMVEAGLAPAAKAEVKAEPAKPVQQKVEHKPQPPNLAAVPAAAHSDTTGNKYAALDRLRDGNDPDAYEDALMALPEKERDRYRASA